MVEIAAVDLVGGEIIPIGSDLVRPPIPIPPEASAIHHITDHDVARAPTLEEVLPFYTDADRSAGVNVFVAHHWAFERQWMGDRLNGRPAICTYKAAIRIWPDAPSHSNQSLRYHLKPDGYRSDLASPAHRALPDAYVTAAILRELIRAASADDLIRWTAEPVLLPTVTFGRYKGSPWDEVPSDYLTWITDKSELGESVKFTAAHALSAR